MARQYKVYRASISIPLDLKKRMDAVTETVNWSAVAAAAFEKKLAEFSARKPKEEVTMQDAIQRLRAERLTTTAMDYNRGHAAGMAWATRDAKRSQLMNLATFFEGLDGSTSYGRDEFFSNYGDSAHSTAEILFFAMSPEHNDDRSEAECFWEEILGETSEVEAAANNYAFLRGFAEGAEAFWDKVKDAVQSDG